MCNDQQLANIIRTVVENLNDQQGYSIEFRNDYGGRGMFGSRCVGIVGSHTECMTAVGEVIKDCHWQEESIFGTVVDRIMNFDRDSMGRDTIYYWQDIEPIEDIDQDD